MGRIVDIDKNKKIKETYLATKAKRENQSCKVFTIKVQKNKLNNIQKETLKMMFVEAKWMYNHILNLSQTTETSIFDMKYTDLETINHYDKERNVVETTLTHLSSQMKQGVLDGIFSNIRGLSKRKSNGGKVGKLKFISEYNSINLKQSNVSYKILSKNKIKIQGIKKPLHVNGLNQIFSLSHYDLANAKLISDVDGYYIKITVYTDKINHIPSEQIGIDFGCQTSLTLSNGEKINCQVNESEQIKNVKRKMSHCKKGSNNKHKLSLKLCQLNKRNNNIKNDFSNKVCHMLLYNYIVVMQDEQLTNWKKLHGKKIQFGILGRVKSKLISNGNTIVLSKWLPTTKLCSSCGHVVNMSLHDRVFHCEHCNISCDRDVHAAENMLFFYNHIIGVEHTKYKLADFKTSLEDYFSKELQEATKSLVSW